VEEESQSAGSDPGPEGSHAGTGPEGSDPSVDEAELRRRIEEGLRKVRMQDVLLESVVTIINLTARRIGKADERDLEQARVGIDAVRAIVDLLEPEPQTQVRNALSELQMLYAQHAGGSGEPEEGEQPGAGPEEPGPGPEEPAGPGLWVPPGS